MLTTIHLLIVGATGLAVLYSDEQALMWMLGKKRVLDAAVISLLHSAVSVGLGLIIITGGILYAEAPRAYLSNTTFIVKMVAVAALIINTYAIGRLSRIARTQAYAATLSTERAKLFASGFVSIAGWGTALLCGYLLQ